MQLEKALITVAQSARDYSDAQTKAISEQIAKVFADLEIIKQQQPLQGEQGPQGPQGPSGQDASAEHVKSLLVEDAQFLTAVKGLQGEQGPQGVAGEKGADGVDGTDASPEHVKELLVLDVDFINSLKGADGKDGLQGEKGADGADGADGANGEDGVSIKSFVFEGDNLVVVMTDGQEVDLGVIKGKDFDADEFYQVFKADVDLINSLKVSDDVVKAQVAELFAAESYKVEELIDNTKSAVFEQLNLFETSLVEAVDAIEIAKTKAIETMVEQGDAKVAEFLDNAKSAINDQLELFDSVAVSVQNKTAELEDAIQIVNTAKIIPYEPKTLYKTGQFVSHNGRYYSTMRDTDSEPGVSDAYNLVLRGFEFKKAWNPETTYEALDVVISATGSAWVANKYSPIGEPGSTPDWNLLAKRGERGAKGDVGPKGDKGESGNDGVGIVHVEYDYEKEVVIFVKSNGHTEQIDFPILSLVKELVNNEWITRHDNFELPISDFKGSWNTDKQYSRGDVIVYGGAAYIAKKDTTKGISPFETYNEEAIHKSNNEWQLFLITGSGGGGSQGVTSGGGGGGGWPRPVLTNLDMNSLSIINMASPTTQGGAATKGYVDANGGNLTKGVVDTAAFNLLTGPSDGDKIDSLFTARAAKAGDLAFVGYDKTKPDNSKAGIYRFSGAWTRVVDLSGGVPKNLDDLQDVVAVAPTANQILVWNAVSKRWEASDNNAAAVIKHFAATAVSAAGSATDSAETILLASYATLAGGPARAGVFAVIENGAGADGRLNGVYYFDGTVWTKFARELSASGAGGLVKALVADTDPNLITSPQPLGTAQYTVENNAKEIKVVDAAGNWNTIYSETNIRNLIAQSRSFKGTVVEKGATVVGTSPLDVLPATTALTATDVGTYYVFVGTGGHVILASEIGGSVSNVDGTVLSPGDWIQVANLGSTATPKYDYVVIHGDALSMARARAVFGLNLWADGAFERGSIVRYQPTPNAGIHYYVASGDVIVGDTAPGAVPPPGVSATPIAVTVTAVTGGKEYNMTVTGGPATGAGVLNVTFDVDSTPGADIQTATITAGMTADQVAAAIVAGWSNPQTTATKGTSPAEVNVKVKNTADSITVFTINAASLGAINATAGVNKWVDITPYAALSSLPDCYELLKATDGQVPSWSVANRRWEPTTPNQPLVYMGTGVWDASKIASRPDNLGFPADTLPAPTVYGPQAGDMYINLNSGKVTSFTGPAPSARTTATFTGGTESPTLDVTQSSIAKLTDVDVATAAPKDGEVLTYDLATTKWVPKKIATSLGDLSDVTEAPISTIGNILVADGTGAWTEVANPSYTKTEVDTKFTAVLTGIAHDIAVKDILNIPPTNPGEGDAYIIGTAPTLGWIGHSNEVAFFDSGAWIFTPAQANEAHLVEALQSIWAWSPPPGGVGASRWVKIANTAGAAGVTAKHGIGEIIPWIADTFPDDYLECKGQIVAVASYIDLHTVIGDKYNAGTPADGVSTFALPDLRGYFLRGVGANGGEGAPGIVQGDTTRLPRTNFTGTTSSAGNHHHNITAGFYNHYATGGGGLGMNDWSTYYDGRTGSTANAGDHTHNITVTGGGDIETRPKSFSVRWLIRYKAIDGGAMGPRGQNGVGVPAITAGDEKKVMTVTAGTAVWAAPAPALPNGTAVGQKLEWNGTIWVPTVDKVTITQGSDYLVDANPAMYEIKGSIWCNSNQWVHLRIYGADGTTLLVPDANWFVSGSAWMQVSAYASLTDSSTDSDTHGGKGYNLLPSGIIEIGKNWVNHLKGWVDIDANMICNARNGRSDNAPITLRYSYHNDQDHQVTGVLRISAPRSVVIGRVQVTSGATETFYNAIVRKTLF